MPKNNRLKRYLVFAWEEYEASGGFNDNIDSCGTLMEAYERLSEVAQIHSEGHVIDKYTGKEVLRIHWYEEGGRIIKKAISPEANAKLIEQAKKLASVQPIDLFGSSKE